MKLLIFLLLSFTLLFGDYLSKGLELEDDGKFRQAFDYFRKSAVFEDSAVANFKLGIIYYRGDIVKKDIKKAVNYFKTASKKGHIKAKYNLAVIYANKKSKYYDPYNAFLLFKEAANSGHAAAANRVGMFYMEGEEGATKVNQLEAFRWFRKAHDGGDLAGSCHLGLQYLFGIGVFENVGYAKTLIEPGYKKKIPTCVKIWRDNKLWKYKKKEYYQFFKK